MTKGIFAAIMAALSLAMGICNSVRGQSGPSTRVIQENAVVDAAPVNAAIAISGTGLVLAGPQERNDPCLSAETAANPTRPAWDYAASTTQCGTVETDYGWMDQPMGGGVRQQILVSSLRYGLTPKLDLRWGVGNRVFQSGGEINPLQGAGDEWVNARYRFLEQKSKMPAMAILYGFKIPTANPAKGFGTGFVDHQIILIASRDLGRNHFDFNTVGTLAGMARGRQGAAQFGLALTRPLNKKLSWILESYGGAQPGTPDRFGAALAGGTYTMRPRLVFDGAFTRTFTAGSPRGQVMFGVTCSVRPNFSPLSRGSAWSRLQSH